MKARALKSVSFTCNPFTIESMACLVLSRTFEDSAPPLYTHMAATLGSCKSVMDTTEGSSSYETAGKTE